MDREPSNPVLDALSVLGRGILCVFTALAHWPMKVFLALVPYMAAAVIDMLAPGTVPAMVVYLYGIACGLMAAWGAIRTERINPEHASPAWAFLGAAIISLPLSFGLYLLATTFASALLVIALIALAVLALIAWSRFSGTGTITRGASSHYNADGRVKKTYPSRSSAQDAVRRYEHDFPGERMNSYRCADCSGWHIGHQR